MYVAQPKNPFNLRESFFLLLSQLTNQHKARESDISLKRN
jgi:hypothetical protein